MLGCVLVGTLGYRLILVGALRAGLPADDLRGITALTLIAAIAAERYLNLAATLAHRWGLQTRSRLGVRHEVA
jgi:putative ABC transport system permease protein